MIYVNGCKRCGRLERGHGIRYTWEGNNVGRLHIYEPPTDTERKRRFRLKWRRA